MKVMTAMEAIKVMTAVAASKLLLLYQQHQLMIEKFRQLVKEDQPGMAWALEKKVVVVVTEATQRLQ